MTRAKPTREWFHDWFGEEYLALYPHRDEREAREAVALFLDVSSPEPGFRVLDLACGAGRHLRELQAVGLSATGLDLSATLLKSARAAAPTDPLVRGDMRELPFSRGAFEGLTSFFTSFGYFAEPDDDRRVLREVSRVLRPGGAFMLDFLNADRVMQDLVAEDCREVGRRRVRQIREIADGVVVKHIRIEPMDQGVVQRFEERVRLYSLEQLESLLADAGLTTTHRFGEYGGAPFTEGSARLILAGRRTLVERETE
ncbi:MAG: class I SAM-dependent methyltransferase [Gemmatimonadetes bacterium]|nr:class I SAM-dependent methyltransferase [Gemmatimonadota bacterium]